MPVRDTASTLSYKSLEAVSKHIPRTSFRSLKLSRLFQCACPCVADGQSPPNL